MGNEVKFGNEQGITEVEMRQRIVRLAGEILHERAVKIEQDISCSYLEALCLAQEQDPENARRYANLDSIKTEPPEQHYSFDNKQGSDSVLYGNTGEMGAAVHEWISQRVADVDKLTTEEYRGWVQRYLLEHPNSGYGHPIIWGHAGWGGMGSVPSRYLK